MYSKDEITITVTLEYEYNKDKILEIIKQIVDTEKAKKLEVNVNEK